MCLVDIRLDTFTSKKHLIVVFIKFICNATALKNRVLLCNCSEFIVIFVVFFRLWGTNMLERCKAFSFILSVESGKF